MTVQVTAYRWVPPIAQGYVKDLRIRWALEEAGVPYQTRLIDRDRPGTEDYYSWQPFGQVPAYQDDVVTLFESGAIVLHIAHRSEALAPRDTAGWARVTAWVFAALNSIEPFAQNVIHLGAAAASSEPVLLKRLESLSRWLGANEYFEGRFTAGDLMLTTVLRELVDGGILSRFPLLDAHRRRCEARPAFDRALQAQLTVFRNNQPA